MTLNTMLATADTSPSEVTVIVLVCLLPLMLILSAFFSGSETALFSLNASQRQQMRKTGGGGAKLALSLLQEPRMLLITLLLGNMTTNVLYFVISSSLLMWLAPSWFIKLVIAVGALLVIVILGEVLPKMAASASPRRISALVAPILLVIHRFIMPIRVVVSVVIVRPLTRITTGGTPSRGLTANELERLLAHSSASGVVNREEQQTLSDVLKLGKVTVRKSMTPRTRAVTIQVDDSPERIRELIERHHFTRIPVHGEDLDDILGVLPVKKWLRSSSDKSVRDVMVPATFIPEVATLELALELFRENGIVFAVVVDEYGGTSGVIALQDIVEELIGDIAEPVTAIPTPPRPLGPGRWIVDGDTSVRHLRDALGKLSDHTHATTLGGLITERLDRLPKDGDRVEIDDLTLDVHHAEEGHVTSVIVSIRNREESS
ncbi:MAG: hemolysin family protein [Planctomycetota bacterium]|nr:hemolysin family protein [Planctomycetota bacterium]